MPPKCASCETHSAAVRRPKTGRFLCHACFFAEIEGDVHETIVREQLLQPGDIVACGASGGKDSTVLIHLLTTLNQRHSYGATLVLVSIDEGIVGYRDDSLKTVARNSDVYGLPLHVLSYKELYDGWTMDRVVSVIGTKNNCTFCGVFRRQALDRGASKIGATKIATGHNADDTAETVIMNLLRSDIPRLARCTSAVTASEGLTPRIKPMQCLYEKEIVLYAHFKKLDYFTTECTYSKEAFRGNARGLLKDLEVIRPRVIADILHSAANLPVPPSTGSSTPERIPQRCSKCGYLTSQSTCRACVLLSSLQAGDPRVALRTTVGAPIQPTGT